MSVDSPALQPATPDSLIEQCLSGDQAAWEAVVRQHWRKVFNVAYKFVGKHDEAEDLAQDIFLKIFKALDTFDRRANFQTWIISIARNLCIDHYRSVRKERETIAREVDACRRRPVGSRDVGPTLEDCERLGHCCNARWKNCPCRSGRRSSCGIAGVSYQEIADRLRLPEGTVKSRINRGRLELARQMQSGITRQADAPPARRTALAGAAAQRGRMNLSNRTRRRHCGRPGRPNRV